MSLLIETKKYAIYVRVLAGEGDGPLITFDGHGIHVHGGDPRVDRVAVEKAVRQIEAGAIAYGSAVQLNPQPLPPKQ
ncbi:MAG: hypothetical protein ABI147_14280 [Acidobacteriaceae bacterium]